MLTVAHASSALAQVGYKQVNVPATLDMIFIPAQSSISGTAVVVFPDIKGAIFYRVLYRHVASGQDGFFPHEAHPNTRDKVTLNCSCGTGEVSSSQGTHWAGIFGAFFPDQGAGYAYLAANATDPRVEATVPDSALNLSVTVPGADSNNLDLGEEFEVRVTIEADPTNKGTMTNVNWTPLTFAPTDMVEVLSGPEPPSIPQNFALAPGAKYIRSYRMRSLRPGDFTLSTDATGKSAAGVTIAPGPSTLNLHFLLDILKVEVEVDKPLVDLEDGEDGPIPQDVIATVKVTNVFDEPVEQVVLDSIDPGSLIAPPIAVGALTVKAGPFDPAGPNPNPAALGTLDPGESVSRTYTLEANDDGYYEVVAFVTAKDPFSAGGFVEVGRTEIKMSGEVVLYFESESATTIDRNGSEWVIGGNAWNVFGNIENRDSEKTILVLLQPQLSGNAFYAQPVPDGTTAPDSVCAMGIARQLAPRERMYFGAEVRTLVDGGTHGTVNYEPKGFVINEDGTRTALTADQVFFKEGSTEHLVRVDVSTEVPIDASFGERVGHFVEGTIEGCGRFAEGIIGLVSMAAHAVKFGLSPWEWPEAYQAAGDKVAKYLLDIYDGLSPVDKQAYNDNVVAAAALALGSTLEDARDLVDKGVAQRFTQLETAYYTGDSRAVAKWFGELAGESPDLAIQALVSGYGICKLAGRGALSVRRGLIGFAESQAATLETRVAQGARGLRAGDLLQYDAHLAKIFGIDKLSDRMLRDLAQKWNILIAVRRRGAGVVHKLATGKFTLKPFFIKAKNVSPIDVDWLGFPAKHLDEVVIKQPPPWLEVETKMKAAFQEAERIEEVRERWKTRWKEWYGKDADPITGEGGNMAKSERGPWQTYEQKGLKVPQNMVLGVEDNVPKGFSIPTDDEISVLRNFRADLIAAADGRPCLVANIEHPIKGWQGVTGDIDPMAFVRPDGTLLPLEARVKLYKAMQHVGFQHPESITWTNDAGRAEYLKEFSVYNPESETLACYRPDGTVVASRFDPGKSWIDPLNFRRSAQMYFRSASTNIRSDPPTPVDMSQYEDLIDHKPTVYVAPNTWAIIDPSCPGNLRLGDASPGVCMVNVHYTDDPDAFVLRQSSLGVLERWTPAGGWRPFVPSGTDIFLLPQTALAADADAGTTVLQIHDLEALGLDPGANAWFAPGQVIVINPGGENEELGVVAGVGSIILESPLQFDHFEGETISVVGELQPSTTLPTTTTTLPLGEPPARPSVLSLTPDSEHPLSEFALEMSPFEDEDEAGEPTAVRIAIGGTLDDSSKGTIFQGELPAEQPQTMRLPLSLLDPGTNYTIVASYVDSIGQVSDFSDPFAFTTVAVDPADADGDGIEDRAELTGEFDLNHSGHDDSTERISVIADAEAGEPVGLFSNYGTLGRLKTLSELETLGAASPASVPWQLPAGLIGARVRGLAAGQEIATTYYLEPETLGVDRFTQYDPNIGFIELTDQATFFDQWVTVARTDGGVGDLDGVANGRIVDTSGPAAEFAGGAVCSAPLTGSAAGPSAADCLFILRTAVKLNTCSPECSCAPKGSVPVTASDALLCLKVAVGVAGLTLNCPCE